MVDDLPVCQLAIIVFGYLSASAVYRKPRASVDQPTDHKHPEKAPGTLKLTDQYIALLVLVFTDAGLLDVSIYLVCVSS